MLCSWCSSVLLWYVSLCLSELSASALVVYCWWFLTCWTLNGPCSKDAALHLCMWHPQGCSVLIYDRYTRNQFQISHVAWGIGSWDMCKLTNTWLGHSMQSSIGIWQGEMVKNDFAWLIWRLLTLVCILLVLMQIKFWGRMTGMLKEHGGCPLRHLKLRMGAPLLHSTEDGEECGKFQTC